MQKSWWYVKKLECNDLERYTVSPPGNEGTSGSDGGEISHTILTVPDALLNQPQDESSDGTDIPHTILTIPDALANQPQGEKSDDTKIRHFFAGSRCTSKSI